MRGRGIGHNPTFRVAALREEPPGWIRKRGATMLHSLCRGRLVPRVKVVELRTPPFYWSEAVT